MATNKNQHFVPRCHLKAFTDEEAGLSIALFNLDRKKLIKNAPVKNQCSRDYFYGSDEELESAIQLIEGSYGPALRNILKNSRKLEETDKQTLKVFWLFQHLRTEAAAMRAIQMAETTRTLAELPPGEFSLGIKEAVRIACKVFASAIHEIDDLKFCLIRNKSNVPFITSDNPAVLTSKWQIERKRTNNFGIGSAGILVMIPLTPKLLFLGYDGDVYSVPHEKGIVEIKSDRDAIAFNRHQFLHCAANVYPGSAYNEASLLEQFKQVEVERPKSRHIVHYAEFDGVDNGHRRYKVINPEDKNSHTEAIMHSQVIHPDPLIWPAQIRIRSNGTVFTNDTGLGYIRYSRALTIFDNNLRKERP